MPPTSKKSIIALDALDIVTLRLERQVNKQHQLFHDRVANKDFLKPLTEKMYKMNKKEKTNEKTEKKDDNPNDVVLGKLNVPASSS